MALSVLGFVGFDYLKAGITGQCPDKNGAKGAPVGRGRCSIQWGVRWLSVSEPLCKKQAGRYKRSIRGDRPLTYEMANSPHLIAHCKSWNSWNTTNLAGGLRQAETLFEDAFIRKFIAGTWHNLFLSEVIIKRQHNTIRIAGIILQALPPRKFYFLIGYTEELLSYWLQYPIKIELQTVANRKEVVFKYI